MNNRFVRLIRSGAIGSIERLKVEFKSIAKLTHPDLAGPGSSAEEFIRVRHEYEAALRDFGRHRFGFAGAAGAAGGARVLDRGALYANLAILLKRGFPKRPRHEKEAKKYEYHKYLVAAQLKAWADPRASLFDAFELGLLALKLGDPPRFRQSLEVLRAVLDYHSGGIELARTAIEVAYPGLADSLEAGALPEFLGLLVADLSRGAALRRA